MKVLLVFLHGGNQCLGGNFQEAFLETAHERHGPLVEGGDFVQQVFIDNRLAARFLPGNGGDAVADLLAAFGEVSDHIPFLAQHHFVVAGRGHDQ